MMSGDDLRIAGDLNRGHHSKRAIAVSCFRSPGCFSRAHQSRRLKTSFKNRPSILLRHDSGDGSWFCSSEALKWSKGGSIMANPSKRVPENVPGDFFVDSTCIDCDACRQIAPSVFGETAETSFVKSQPVSGAERREALRALLACPTGSIGSLGDEDVKAVMKDFPLVVEEPVYYCGFNSPKSYGGNSYFIRHAAGNWLIDSPKFVRPLVKQLAALGGVGNIFLTHRDDVADADRYAEHFQSRRIIHREELSSQPGAEVVLDGAEPWELASGFLAITTPGHTRGHCALLFRDRFLFTGDHLDWDRDEQRLSASEDYCWYSWPRQAESMQRLADYRFEWVLPGHGQRVHLPADEMRRQIVWLTASMRNG
jgi:glyoxylase-like metal-dependent hydrolase (beta-lactamase superfamily II)/ferredoxin